MKTEGSKEHLAYQEAKKNYLAIGKRYSALLQEVMRCDPNILKLAEDILITGDGLSMHDNRFLTTFYKELKAKSKIDKKYYDILLELKKTKNELDHATHALSKLRVGSILRKAGIPQKRTNQDIDAILSQVNNNDVSLLEKISLPDVLGLGDAEKLEEYIAYGDVAFLGSDLQGQTKVGRGYLRNLEKSIQSNINDRYFLDSARVDIRSYIGLGRDNILELMRISGDKEHVREIERRIATGDIRLQEGDLIPLTPRGKKYLNLLTEELTAELEKRVDDSIHAANKESVHIDPRLGAIRGSLQDLDISLGKHAKIGALAGDVGTYQGILKVAHARKEQIGAAVADIMVTQETIASSFLEIKKQLLAVVDKKSVKVDRLLSLLVAVRYLSVFEKEYESKLARVERLLGLPVSSRSRFSALEPLTSLTERYEGAKNVTKGEADRLAKDAVAASLAKRHRLGEDTDKLLTTCLLGSIQARELEETMHRQESVRRHAVDVLYSSESLYEGLDSVSEILTELTELEIEKKERLAELVHELELSHKELWLSGIKNSNVHFIDTNFGTLPETTKNKSKKANSEAIAAARKEIRDTLRSYRQLHRKHSDEFASFLQSSLSEISKGGDVGRISRSLKQKYQDLGHSHETILADMERDIVLLEKRLLEFEEKTPAEIEKLLMADIRSSI